MVKRKVKMKGHNLKHSKLLTLFLEEMEKQKTERVENRDQSIRNELWRILDIDSTER